MANKKNKKEKTDRSKKELSKRLASMDKKLAQAEKDLVYLERFLKRFKKIQKNLDQLENYYFTDWMEDVDTFYKDNVDAHCACCGQDSIWNVSQDIYQARVKIVKEVVKGI